MREPVPCDLLDYFTSRILRFRQPCLVGHQSKEHRLEDEAGEPEESGGLEEALIRASSVGRLDRQRCGVR